MRKQEIVNPYELGKDVKLKKQKIFYSKSKAIKYLQAKSTHSKVTKKLFKELDQTGRLLPDRRRGFMQFLNKALTTVLIVTLLANAATLLMGLFYFFNLPLFELWIVENVVLFFETLAKLEVKFRIFNHEDYC